MIGSSSLDGVPLIPGMIRVAWLIVSFQGFQQQILLAPWQSLQSADITGPPMVRNLAIVGSMFRASGGRIAHTTPVAKEISFRDVAFHAPLDQIARTINAYCQEGASRSHLPSWHE